jgi:hypothetical protein
LATSSRLMNPPAARARVISAVRTCARQVVLGDVDLPLELAHVDVVQRDLRHERDEHVAPVLDGEAELRVGRLDLAADAAEDVELPGRVEARRGSCCAGVLRRSPPPAPPARPGRGTTVPSGSVITPPSNPPPSRRRPAPGAAAAVAAEVSTLGQQARLRDVARAAGPADAGGGPAEVEVDSIARSISASSTGRRAPATTAPRRPAARTAASAAEVAAGGLRRRATGLTPAVPPRSSCRQLDRGGRS